MTKDLVIARYNEDLSWLNCIDCFDRVFVYNKGDSLSDDEIKLPNIGREAHTFMFHIVEKYNELADISVFVQGNPFPHLRSPSCSTGEELNALFKKHKYNLQQPEPLFSGLFVDLKHFTAVCYKDCLEGPVPNPIEFNSGAQWIAPKDGILSKSLNFYKRIYKELQTDRLDNWDGIYNGWNLEGMWGYIFNSNTKEITYEYNS